MSCASSPTRAGRPGSGRGLYLSPWDRNAASYGDSPRYNDFYCDQLTELLTGYGPLWRKSGSTAPTARDPTAGARSTTGRGSSAPSGGSSPMR